jgi:hypothetical protein
MPQSKNKRLGGAACRASRATILRNALKDTGAEFLLQNSQF